MNIWDIAILLLVCGAAGIAALRLRRRKTDGCGGDCACCAARCPRKEHNG